MTNCVLPKFSGLRCLMMPYIQGEPESVPGEFAAYYNVERGGFVFVLYALDSLAVEAVK